MGYLAPNRNENEVIFRAGIGETIQFSGGAGQVFELSQPGQRVRSVAAAHIGRRHQLQTDGRALCLTKDTAVVGIVQLHAAHAGWLAQRHAWNR